MGYWCDPAVIDSIEDGSFFDAYPDAAAYYNFGDRTAAAAGRASLGVRVSNAWTEALGEAIGAAYPWLGDGDAIVDAHRPFSLEVDGASADCDCVWSVAPADGGAAASFAGCAVDVPGRPPSSATVRAEVTCGGETTEVGPAAVHSLWVRREIRDLAAVDGELDRYLDTLLKLYTASGDEGRATYGADFRSMGELSVLHLENAGARTTDHFHEGSGFVPQHVKLTRTVERSLQSVDPAMTIPYHDMSIEAGLVSDGVLDSVFDDKRLWSEAVYGSAPAFRRAASVEHMTESLIAHDAKTERTYFAIPDGRWAFLTLPDHASGGGSVENAYGLLRAPWNQNPSTFVTRLYSDTYIFSDCESLSAMVNPGWRDEDDVFSPTVPGTDVAYWSYLSEFTVHGNMHGAVGGHVLAGSTATDAALATAKQTCVDRDADAAAVLGITDASLSDTYDYFFDGRALWHQGYLEYPSNCRADDLATDAYACRPSCNSDDRATGEQLLRWHLWDRSSGGSLTADVSACLSDEDLAALGSAFCAAAPFAITGDHAITSMDPSFHPVHSALERIFALAVINGAVALPESEADFTNFCRSAETCEDQSNGGLSCCFGHGYGDRWFENEALGRTTGMTNADALAQMDPLIGPRYSHPVYQNFAFSACSF